MDLRQVVAYGLAAGDELRREATRIVVDVPTRGGRAVGRQIDQWLSVGVPWVLDLVLSKVDLTDVVIENVDMDRLISSVDLDAAVRQVDLIGLAQYIIDGVDLPAIVRSSSASFTTEAVHGLRVHGVEADQAVSRVVGHLIPRRRSPNGESRRPAPPPPTPTAWSVQPEPLI